MRCAQPGRNDKLAGVPAWIDRPSGERAIGVHYAIETRGEGGYAVIPTPRSNRTWVNGDLTTTPTVPMEVATALLDATRKLDQSPKPAPAPSRSKKKPAKRQGSTGESSSVIAAYNEANDIEDLLETYGYIYVGEEKRWLAPNSTSNIPGVTLLDGRAWSWHSSDLLNDGHTHDAFSVYTLLEHGGDVTAAVRAAASELGLTGTHQAVNKEHTPASVPPASVLAPPQAQLPDLEAPPASARLIYLGRDATTMQRIKGGYTGQRASFVAAMDLEAQVHALRLAAPLARLVFVAAHEADAEPHRLGLEFKGTVATLTEGLLGAPQARTPCGHFLLHAVRPTTDWWR